MNKIVAAIILLFIFSIMTSCSAINSNSKSIPDQVVEVQRGDLNINIKSVGNLVTANEAKLTFGASGKVKEVLIKLGDSTKAGDVIASLETFSLERAVVQAQLNVKSARQSLENAKEPKTNTSGTTILSAPDPLNIEIKEFQLESAELDLQEAEQNLINATLKSPFNGLIAAVNVKVGDQVNENTEIIRLIDQSKFKVTVLVNEADIGHITVNAAATVQVEATPSVVFPAKIALISPVATIQSGVVSYQVEVEFDSEAIIANGQQGQSNQNTQQGVQRPQTQNNSTAQQETRQQNQSSQFAGQQGQRPQRSQQQTTTVIPKNSLVREGQTVIANILIDSVSNVLLVPSRAIISRGGKNYVMVMTSTGGHEERVVQAGISDGESTQIITGLSENEQVIISQSTVLPASTSNTQQQPQQKSNSGVVPGINRILR